LNRFAGHRDFVLSVAFAGVNGSMGRVDERGEPVSTAGSEVLAEVEWIVSASKDRTITFWDGRAAVQHSRHYPQKPLDVTAVTQFMLQGHKNSGIILCFFFDVSFLVLFFPTAF
jgi:hypothetical protein